MRCAATTDASARYQAQNGRIDMGIQVIKKTQAGVHNPGFAEISPGETPRPGFYASKESVERDTPSGVFCDHCGLEFDEGYRPDPCIGTYLPGVASACCGHGKMSEVAVTLGDGALPDQAIQDLGNLRYLFGDDALEYLDNVGVGPSKYGPLERDHDNDGWRLTHPKSEKGRTDGAS